MATVTLYGFEDASGAEDTYTTFDYNEATVRARKYNLRLIAHEYQWEDSEVIADYTGVDDPKGKGKP